MTTNDQTYSIIVSVGTGRRGDITSSGNIHKHRTSEHFVL